MKRQMGAVVAVEEIWPVMLSGISAAALLFPPTAERLQYTSLTTYILWSILCIHLIFR